MRGEASGTAGASSRGSGGTRARRMPRWRTPTRCSLAAALASYIRSKRLLCSGAMQPPSQSALEAMHAVRYICVHVRLQLLTPGDGLSQQTCCTSTGTASPFPDVPCLQDVDRAVCRQSARRQDCTPGGAYRLGRSAQETRTANPGMLSTTAGTEAQSPGAQALRVLQAC